MKYAARDEEGGRVLRAFALAFGAGAVAFVLVACASGPMASGEHARVTPPGAPAQDERTAALAAPPSLALARFDPSAEGVEIVPLEGTSTPMAKLLQRSVVDAFGRHNVPASPSSGSGRYRLSGHAAPNRDLAQPSVVAIEWQIFDRRQGRETGRFMLPVVGDHFSWDNGDPRVIAQVGEETSRRFVALVDGARARAVNHGPRDMPAFASPPSPAEASTPASRATPASGTSNARPHVFAEPAAYSAEAAASAAKAGSAGMPADLPSPAPRDRPEAGPRTGSAGYAKVGAPAGAKAGSAPVFITRVGGAPGDGDAALARAARAALVVGGLATAARREDARYIVAGSVNVGAPAQGRQLVRIVWEVSAPDGRPLGRAVQENAVAEGSLNGSWGPMASLVAGAAVKGIADVIHRADETASRAGESPGALNDAPLSGRAVPPGGGQNTESPRALNDAPLSGRAVPSESAARRLEIPPAAAPGAQAPKSEDPAASFAPGLLSGRPAPPGGGAAAMPPPAFAKSGDPSGSAAPGLLSWPRSPVMAKPAAAVPPVGGRTIDSPPPAKYRRVTPEGVHSHDDSLAAPGEARPRG